MKKTVHYFCFGVDSIIKDKLTYFPSAQPKIRYIIDTLKRNGYTTNMVSSCSIKKNGFFKRQSYSIDHMEKHIYFSSFKSSNKLINKISILFSFIQFIFYIVFIVKKGDLILIYHSLYYLKPIRILKKIKKFKFILEVEEIYSYLSEENRKFENEESELINSASAYLLVNDLLDEKIPLGSKKAIISYGN